jgi:hypothetical protein
VSTHEETIQVPDGWTIENCHLNINDAEGCTGAVIYLKLEAKPLPPPEPAIEPCAYCGGELDIRMVVDGWFKVIHYGLESHCNVRFDGLYFTTRLAAIEAANRRAK